VVPAKATYLRNCLNELQKTAVNPIVRFMRARTVMPFCRPKRGTRINPAAKKLSKAKPNRKAARITVKAEEGSDHLHI